eukprot:5850391-Pleurochrysis_carterae.AAC.1
MAKRVASAESDALLKLARWLHRVASQRTGTETKPVSAAAAAAAAATLAAAEAAHRDALTALQQICVFGQPAKVGKSASSARTCQTAVITLLQFLSSSLSPPFQLHVCSDSI